MPCCCESAFVDRLRDILAAIEVIKSHLTRGDCWLAKSREPTNDWLTIAGSTPASQNP